MNPRAEFEEILRLRSEDWSDLERTEARRVVEEIRGAYDATMRGGAGDFFVLAKAAQAIATSRRHTCVDVIVEWLRTLLEEVCALLEGRRWV